ncbi:MAG: amidophosphoribosyltransferase [Paludibacteraceae bacterium]|jgi:amidophosphoribosyltransferase|nr:amidophosphoribosyltransferase [Paludibacteraceae bacterium]HOI27620.1 amidophosphoribosyltransferase [Paludibacteraceae bacterium]HPH63152.1 amidophosphoribosyltransferase [Paludibacteraceae bacterium]
MGGFFGTISKNKCVNDLFYGTDYNSHLGTKRGGMSTFDSKNGFSRSIHNLESSYFRTKFEPDLAKFDGNAGIGVVSDTDAQPIVINSHLGRFALVTIACVNNIEELADELLAKNMHFSELSSGRINQTELIALLITDAKSIKEGIENVFRKVKGSCSLLMLTENSIIAARDKLGRMPMIIASKEGANAVSCESCTFHNLGYEPVYNLGPGEIMEITADGYTQMRAPNKKMQICSFLWVYYGYPVSTYENVNVDCVRYCAGCLMGKKDDCQADFVAGIPDSGVGFAIGYAAGKNIPYKRAMIKYTPTWPRSFTPATQEIRSFIAKMKLIPNKQLLKDSEVIFCDDSIVRGTQLSDNVEALFRYGAKNVHMRISCPPLIYPCQFLNFASKNSDLDLITRRIIQKFEGRHDKNLDAYKTTGSPEYNRMVEDIRQTFKLSSLKFSSIEDLVTAIGLPKEQICTHCFDGSSYFD